MNIQQPAADFAQHYGSTLAYNAIWSVSQLQWIPWDGSVTGGGGGGLAVTIADGADVAEGRTTDAAVTGDNPGTISAKLRGQMKILTDVWDSTNHRLQTAVTNATDATPLVTAWTPSHSMMLDFSGGTNPIYVGLAVPSTATGTAAWLIRKIAYDANNNPLSILTAGGAATYTQVWDNRTGLTYS
jgi:hypothetical protein